MACMEHVPRPRKIHNLILSPRRLHPGPEQPQDTTGGEELGLAVEEGLLRERGAFLQPMHSIPFHSIHRQTITTTTTVVVVVVVVVVPLN